MTDLTVYPANQQVRLSVSLPDIDTRPYSANWQVEDKNGVVLSGSNEILPENMNNGGGVTVVVPPEFNQISAGELKDIRFLTISYRESTTSVPQKIKLVYGIRAVVALVTMKNSFQTYSEGLLVSLDIPELDDFRNATEEQRIQAMIQAYNNLVRLSFRISSNNTDYWKQNHVTDFPGQDSGIGDLTAYSLLEFNALDSRFLATLRRAQIIEANALLKSGDSDSVDSKREQGILSSTIGEVSQMFRSGRPMTTSVSRRTLNELKGYLSYSIRVGRA